MSGVPRIAAPSPEALLRDWILPQRPVVLVNLFDDAPIRRVADIDAAGRELGHVELEIQPNYMIFLTGEIGERRRMSLGDYLDYVATHPRTTDLCVEFETPTSLRDLFPETPYAALRDGSDTVSATFLANAGNYNHLHYDDDQRDVLLYQVFGTKRFVLISPDENRKLDNYVAFLPTTRRAIANVPARDANGRVYFEELSSPAVQQSYLEYLHAHEVVLQPGETLFIPALMWHYVEYVDTSLSITHRLGRNRLNRALHGLFPYPDTFVQTIGATLVDEHRFSKEHPVLAAELDAALAASYASESARADAVYAVLLRAFEQVTGHSARSVLATREMHRMALKGGN